MNAISVVVMVISKPVGSFGRADYIFYPFAVNKLLNFRCGKHCKSVNTSYNVIAAA
jgi:hypothetical protein